MQFADGELGQIYKEQTIQEILTTKTLKEEPKKKKKTRKANGMKKDDDVEKSPTSDEKENADQKMDVDAPAAEISITNLSESINEIIPVGKIIKSSEIFSPEKQLGSPAKPIEVRKFPRNIEEIDSSPPKNDNCQVPAVTTPKGSNFFSSKTPTRIEVRRYSRVPQAQPAEKDESLNTLLQSPMDRKLPAVSTDHQTPKTPRRVELQTISTPKSKKKLL